MAFASTLGFLCCFYGYQPCGASLCSTKRGRQSAQSELAVFPHRLMCLSTCSPDDGAVLEDWGNRDKAGPCWEKCIPGGWISMFYSQFYFLSTLFLTAEAV